MWCTKFKIGLIYCCQINGLSGYTTACNLRSNKIIEMSKLIGACAMRTKKHGNTTHYFPSEPRLRKIMPCNETKGTGKEIIKCEKQFWHYI